MLNVSQESETVKDLHLLSYLILLIHCDVEDTKFLARLKNLTKPQG